MSYRSLPTTISMNQLTMVRLPSRVRKLSSAPLPLLSNTAVASRFLPQVASTRHYGTDELPPRQGAPRDPSAGAAKSRGTSSPLYQFTASLKDEQRDHSLQQSGKEEQSSTQKQQTITTTAEPVKKVGKFNQMWFPSRKLSAQRTLEALTGRGNPPSADRADMNNVLAVGRPRRERIAENADWSSVWPAAASYRWSTVPLPLRMGWVKRTDLRPPVRAKGNLELVKIPNFLHLTPTHIKKQCDAIKKFCTPFPAELLANPQWEGEYLPLVYNYDDFVHQGTSIRDMRARVVTLRFPLSALRLDAHASQKFIQLLGTRYDEKSDMVTIVADRCPTRKQNRDYANYLLTALYHESRKVEAWETKASQRREGDVLPVREDGYRVPLDVEAYKREAIQRLGLAKRASAQAS